MPRWPGKLGIWALLVVVVMSCGGSRPTLGEWEPLWRSAQAAVPGIDELTGPDSRMACHDALVALREMRATVEPPSDRIIDSTVSDWFNLAESAMFECPPPGDPDYSSILADLARLAAEVDSVIELDR